MKSNVVRKVGLMLSLVVASALSSCGGGTQIEAFVPNRIIVFGDENNVIDSAGRKYSINGLNATSGALDCTVNPIWIQSMATAYGFVFPDCNPTNRATTSRIYAVADSKTADVKTQIDGFLAAGGVFNPKDLVLMMSGQNDVWEQYALYPATPIETLNAELTRRGVAYAQQVNRIAGLGAKIVVPKLFQLGWTPFAGTEQVTQTTGDNRVNVIRSLVKSFNDGWFATLVNDANHIGQFDPDQNFSPIVANAGNAGLSNSRTAACLATAVLPNCNSQTLIPGATATSYLWADAKRLGYQGHLQLSSLAFTRSNGNPF
jgi:hypothetical protein